MNHQFFLCAAIAIECVVIFAIAMNIMNRKNAKKKGMIYE